MNELIPLTKDAQFYRIKELEGALTLALATFTDDERKGKYERVVKWITTTLKGEPGIIDVSPTPTKAPVRPAQLEAKPL